MKPSDAPSRIDPSPVSRPATAKQRARQLARKLIGTTVADRYRIVDILGLGGFGTVFLAESLDGPEGRIALKIVHPSLSGEQKVKDRFLNEILTAKRIVHRYVVQIRDFGATKNGRLYYTMDYCPGETLGSVLKREKKLDVERTYNIVRKCLRALSTAHGNGIIHRDLKPANVMLLSDRGRESVRILDFGIATSLALPAGKDARGLGSRHYMPPEQFVGGRLGRYTDLYAVGVLLYQCLTGTRPHTGETAQDVYESILKNPVEPPSELAPQTIKFDGLDEIVLKALAPKAEARYQTAREFCTELIDVFQRARERRSRFGFGRLRRRTRSRPE